MSIFWLDYYFFFWFHVLILKQFVVSVVYKRCATGFCPGPHTVLYTVAFKVFRPFDLMCYRFNWKLIKFTFLVNIPRKILHNYKEKSNYYIMTISKDLHLWKEPVESSIEKSEVSIERVIHTCFVVFIGIIHMSHWSKSVHGPIWLIRSAFIVSTFIPFLGFLTFGLKCSVFLFAGVVMQRGDVSANTQITF